MEPSQKYWVAGNFDTSTSWLQSNYIKSRFISNHLVLLQFLWFIPSHLFIDFTHVTVPISAKANSVHPECTLLHYRVFQSFQPTERLISFEAKAHYSYHSFDPCHVMFSEIFFCFYV